MTTQDFASMLAGAKKSSGLIGAGGVTLQCIAAQHGVSKQGGDPQIIGSYKIIGGQFNGRTMKAWFTLKSDTPFSVTSFFEDMAAHGVPEQDIIALGNPNDQAMAAIAARMVNRVVGADVYHQDDNRNPGKKSAWLRAFRAHTGPVPAATANGAAPAPAPAPSPYAGQQAVPAPVYQAPAQIPAPVYQAPPNGQQPPVYGQPQAPAPAPVYQQQAPAPQYGGGAPATHTGAPAQHSGAQYQPQAPAPQQAQAPAPAPVYQAPADQVQAPQPPAPVPGETAYTEEPPF